MAGKGEASGFLGSVFFFLCSVSWVLCWRVWGLGVSGGAGHSHVEVTPLR